MKKETVLRHFGSQRKLAAAFKPPITQSAVAQWGQIIPELAARKIADMKISGLKFDPSLYSKT